MANASPAIQISLYIFRSRVCSSSWMSSVFIFVSSIWWKGLPSLESHSSILEISMELTLNTPSWKALSAMQTTLPLPTWLTAISMKDPVSSNWSFILFQLESLQESWSVYATAVAFPVKIMLQAQLEWKTCTFCVTGCDINSVIQKLKASQSGLSDPIG